MNSITDGRSREAGGVSTPFHMPRDSVAISLVPLPLHRVWVSATLAMLLGDDGVPPHLDGQASIEHHGGGGSLARMSRVRESNI